MFSGGLCGGWSVGGLLLMIGFWLLVVAVVVWAISRLFPRGDRIPDGDASDDLDYRLAGGDIDSDTYRRLRAGHVGGTPPLTDVGARR
jgi:uncharacterized membrane protein